MVGKEKKFKITLAIAKKAAKVIKSEVKLVTTDPRENYILKRLVLRWLYHNDADFS